jgi:hypothetical protein
MTREEALDIWLPIISMGIKDMPEIKEAFDMAIKALEQEPCGDVISRDAVLDIDFHKLIHTTAKPAEMIRQKIEQLPPVNPQEPKTGHCKECKYFEYDSVAKVDGIPLIVAHEICNKWGDGCKTKEDGYCFLFEPQKSEVEE